MIRATALCHDVAAVREAVWRVRPLLDARGQPSTASRKGARKTCLSIHADATRRFHLAVVTAANSGGQPRIHVDICNADKSDALDAANVGGFGGLGSGAAA